MWYLCFINYGFSCLTTLKIIRANFIKDNKSKNKKPIKLNKIIHKKYNKYENKKHL